MILWIEGFEGMGPPVAYPYAAPAPSGVLARKYGAVSGETFFRMRAGRISGTSLSIDSYGDWIRTPTLPTTNSTMILGFGYRVQNYPGYTLWIVGLYDDTDQGVVLTQTTSGEFAVYCGSLLGTTSGAAVGADTWCHIQMKVVCGTSGSVELKINGTTQLTLSGVNTKGGAHNYHNRALFEGGNGYTLFDDIYILDGSGSANNNFLGDMIVVGMLPNADTGTPAWITSSGSDHFSLVNENPADDDTSYVESETPGDTDLFDYANATGLGTIAGIQINTEVRETNAAAFNLKTVIKSGSTQDDGTSQTVGTTSYVTKTRISETDPNISSSWTLSTLNAAKFGAKVA